MFRLIYLFILCSGLLAQAADWPQWRGPNRDGKSAETGLLAAWPANGPKLVWKATGLGEGYSSFSVVGNRLFTQGQTGRQQYVLALDVRTGKQLWKTMSGVAYENDKGNGPRGTPTIDGNRLYALASDGMLLCLDVETGKRIWGFNIAQRFGGSVPRWGYSESPLVEGNRLIITPGGRGAAVVALDKTTGEPIWKSQSDGAGYSSAFPYDAGGKRAMAILTANAAIGLNLSDGALLWRYAKVVNRVANIATPIVSRGHVFLSTNYDTGCALLKLSESDGSASEVYFNRNMQNHYTTSMLIGDTLYGFSSEIFTAMDFMTGKVLWRDRSVGKGNCIFADGKLYCMGESGNIGLIDPSPQAYREISRFRIDAGAWPTWTPMVIADGKLYVREQDNLYSYDIRQAN